MQRFNLMVVSIGIAVLLSACADEPQFLAPDLAPEASHALTSADEPAFTGEYMILGRGGNLPNDLAARIHAAGGELRLVIPEIGVAFAAPVAPGFVASVHRMPGVEAVVPDVMLQWTSPDLGRDTQPLTEADLSQMAEAIAQSSFDPNLDAFYALQWAPRAVQADEAWAAGYTGQGVRVAILDGGIHSAHLDLAPNLDVAASRSFTTGAFNTDLGTFWHGTHVAGIVAAAANGIGTIGIAPNATLIGVKVLHGGSGPFSSILQGIVYAATSEAIGGAGADIINMSLGAVFDYRNNWANKGFRDGFQDLMAAVDRATRFAHQQGVTVIAAAGNGATNYDVARELFGSPAQNQHVITVSATGPHGWLLGNDDFHRPAYYTDHGKSLVDLAAPGGTVGLFVVDGVDAICPTPFIVSFCETFDMVISTVRGSGASTTTYSWAQGTSMAAPLVAGIAALIIERHGTSHPAQVRSRLQQAAADLGAPGNDEWYGHGWVNALRAVQ